MKKRCVDCNNVCEGFEEVCPVCDSEELTLEPEEGEPSGPGVDFGPDPVNQQPGFPWRPVEDAARCCGELPVGLGTLAGPDKEGRPLVFFVISCPDCGRTVWSPGVVVEGLSVDPFAVKVRAEAVRSWAAMLAAVPTC